MKTTKIMKKLGIVAILWSLFFLPFAGMSQDSGKKELKMKIVKEKNGEKTVIDTVLSLENLPDSDEIAKLKELLSSEKFQSMGIDVDDLNELNNFYLYDMDESGNSMVFITSEIETDEEGTQNVEFFVSSGDGDDMTEGLKWVTTGDGSAYFFTQDGDSTLVETNGDQSIVVKSTGEGNGSQTFTFTDEVSWTDTGSTQVDVKSTPEGHTIKVTREDGTVEEYNVEEEGAYIITKDGEIQKVEEDKVVWDEEGEGMIWLNLNNDGPNSNIVVQKMGDGTQEININGMEKQLIISTDENTGTEDVNVFVKKYDSKDGHKKVIVEKKVILTKLTKDDLKRFEKSGVPMNDQLDKLEIENLSFNPNPSNGKFSLEFKTPGTGETVVEIYDMNGRRVYQETMPNFEGNYKNEIDISHENQGVYLLKIVQGSKVSTRKIILE